MRPSAIAVLWLAVPALAQKPDLPRSADELTHAWVQQMMAEDASPTPDRLPKFTYLVHHHEQSSLRGQVTDDHTETSERIFIGGEPYFRQLEKDGKPLKGRDLQHETERYEQTVRERTSLRPSPNAEKNKTHHWSDLPKEQLDSAFSHKITGAETINGHLFVDLELSPLNPDAPAKLQRHIRVTIDPENLSVISLSIEYLASSDGFSKGTTIEDRQVYLDGVLVPAFFRFETFVGTTTGNALANWHNLSTDTYSDFKRYTTLAAVGPDAPK